MRAVSGDSYFSAFCRSCSRRLSFFFSFLSFFPTFFHGWPAPSVISALGFYSYAPPTLPASLDLAPTGAGALASRSVREGILRAACLMHNGFQQFPTRNLQVPVARVCLRVPEYGAQHYHLRVNTRAVLIRRTRRSPANACPIKIVLQVVTLKIFSRTSSHPERTLPFLIASFSLGLLKPVTARRQSVTGFPGPAGCCYNTAVNNFHLLIVITA